jgi:hypothetical protein
LMNLQLTSISSNPGSGLSSVMRSCTSSAQDYDAAVGRGG